MKSACQIIRCNYFYVTPGADIVIIYVIIAHKQFAFILKLLLFFQKVISRIVQRQSSVTAFCLGMVGVIAARVLLKCFAYCYCAVDEIDVLPFKTQHLTSAETVNCTKSDGQFNGTSFEQRNKFVKLFVVEKFSFVFLFLRQSCRACWIERNISFSDRIGKCLAYVLMVVPYCCSGKCRTVFEIAFGFEKREIINF